MTDMNRFITEKVMGQCWHEPDRSGARNAGNFICKHCGWILWNSHQYPDYTTPADYFALLQQKAIGSEWWNSFLEHAFVAYSREQRGWSIDTLDMRYEYVDFIKWLLAPENFARLVAKYHGYKEEEK
jgi:hypothetical protein